MDNGPEFVAHALNAWCRFIGARSLFINPGSPWQNGWIESCNTRLRDEFLNGQQFDTHFESKVLLSDWRPNTITKEPTTYFVGKRQSSSPRPGSSWKDPKT